jgi:hypothetical protein
MKFRSTALTAAIATVAIIATVTTAANAGAYKVYGSQFAWDNNFNNSNIGVSFGSGSTPNMTVSYNFGTGNLYGYPACIQGWHYGWNPAGSTKYPKQIKYLGTDSAYFSWSSGGSNMHGDFAYDMFLRRDSSKSTPQTEVMIWGKNNSWPIGTKVRSNTVNGMDLWQGYNSAAGYEVFSFVPAGTGGGSAWSSTSGSLNINVTSFLNYLCSNYGSYINNSWYLDVVEGGIEITGGDGWDWVQMSN